MSRWRFETGQNLQPLVQPLCAAAIVGFLAERLELGVPGRAEPDTEDDPPSRQKVQRRRLHAPPSTAAGRRAA